MSPDTACGLVDSAVAAFAAWPADSLPLGGVASADGARVSVLTQTTIDSAGRVVEPRSDWWSVELFDERGGYALAALTEIQGSRQALERRAPWVATPSRWPKPTGVGVATPVAVNAVLHP